MEEQLVSFETAKLAKEKGFDIPVRNYVALSGKDKNVYEGSDSDYWGDNRLVNWNNGLPIKPFGEGLSVPTQSLLQKWLREVHQVHIAVTYTGKYFYKYKKGYGSIYVNPPLQKSKTYEDALESGLQEALKLLKP